MKKPAAKKLPALTQRERTIITLICNEYTTAEIAEKFELSPRTLEELRQLLFKKLGVRTALGLLKYAHKKGLYTIR